VRGRKRQQVRVGLRSIAARRPGVDLDGIEMLALGNRVGLTDEVGADDHPQGRRHDRSVQVNGYRPHVRTASAMANSTSSGTCRL